MPRLWTSDRRGRLAASLVTLYAEVNRRWPGRDTSSDGSIGDTAHGARASDHNLVAGVVRALDIDDDDATEAEEGIGRVIAEHLRRTRDPRVKYLIYHGQMCSSYPTSTHPAWAWRPYTGANAHRRHLHVSVVADARADDRRPWGIGAPAVTAPTPQPIRQEDDDMTPQQAQQLADIHARFASSEWVQRVADVDRALDEQTDKAAAASVVDALGRIGARALLITTEWPDGKRHIVCAAQDHVRHVVNTVDQAGRVVVDEIDALTAFGAVPAPGVWPLARVNALARHFGHGPLELRHDDADAGDDDATERALRRILTDLADPTPGRHEAPSPAR